MNRVVPSDWAGAKLAEHQAYKRISEARSQADWLKAWETWASTLQRLRQQARHPEPAAQPESELELAELAEQAAQSV